MAGPRRFVGQLPPRLNGLEGPFVRSVAGSVTTDSGGDAPQAVAGAGQRRTAAALPPPGMENSRTRPALQRHDHGRQRTWRIPFTAPPASSFP